MKKLRSEKAPATAISLSSKRGTLHHDQLFVPYKIDWKGGAQVQNVQNTNSKAFFQNMKAQLSNIKNDFEKLIHKEINLKNDEYPKSNSLTSKPKCMSSNKKDDRKMFNERYPQNQKMDTMMSHRCVQDNACRILNLEKNLPCSGSILKNAISKTVGMKQNLPKPVKSNQDQYEDLSRPIESNYMSYNNQSYRQGKFYSDNKSSIQQKDYEISQLKQSLYNIQNQLIQTKKQRDFTKNEMDKIFKEKNFIIGKVTQLSDELSNKLKHMENQQIKIQKLTEQIRLIQDSNKGKQIYEQQFNHQRQFYNDKINQLMFHNQNFSNINMQLGGEIQMLKEKEENLERFIEDNSRRNLEIQTDFNRKIQYMQRDIQEYQKREDMFSRQIENLNQQISSYQSNPQGKILENNTVSTDVRDLQEEILTLNDQITHLKKQVQIEKQIHTTLSQRYEQQISSLKIEDISRQFEVKINKLIDQNYKLKNRVNFCESTLESTTQQNKSFVQQIMLYQQREKNMLANKKLTSNEWEEMVEEIDRLKEDNRRLMEQIQYKNLKKDVQLQGSSNNTSNECIMRLANAQIAQNIQLKETIKHLSQRIKHFEKQLQQVNFSNCKLKQELIINSGSSPNLQAIKRRHCQLYSQIQQKTSQFAKLKDILFKVIIEKVNKLEDQDDIQYYLKEIDLRSKLI